MQTLRVESSQTRCKGCELLESGPSVTVGIMRRVMAPDSSDALSMRDTGSESAGQAYAKKALTTSFLLI